jgi:phage shock protein PspC (stress-responsive transcriptional regulator)
MNKVVSINLNGIIISIDEVAYEQLKRYIDALHKHFNGTDGGAEITSDIETRIAELLQLKLSDVYPVIQAIDVQNVIAIMGNPWEMNEEEGETKGEQAKATISTEPKKLKRDPRNKILSGVCGGLGNFFNVDPIIARAGFLISFFAFGSGLLLYVILWVIMPEAKANELPHFSGQPPRKLFRNPDNKTIGGVCSGIAVYLGIDEIWLRGAFAISFFAFGSGLLLYIVLWIIIPEAKTASEKLQMKGDLIDVQNIEREVRNAGTTLKRTANSLGNGMTSLAKAIAVLIGIFILLIFVLPGVVGLIFLFIGLEANPDVKQLVSQFLINPDVLFYAQWGIAALVTSAVLGFGILGIRLLTKFNILYGIVGSVILLFAGLTFGGVALTKYFSEVKGQSNVVQVYKPFAVKDTFEIEVFNVQDGPVIHTSKFTITNHNSFGWMLDNKQLMIDKPDLTIKASDDQFAVLRITKSSQGKNNADANELAKQCSINQVLTDSLLRFDNWVSLGDETTPYKHQKVDLELRLPIGTVVKISDDVSWHLKNDNEDDDDDCDDDRDVIYYKVTKSGLRCITNYTEELTLETTETEEVDTIDNGKNGKTKVTKSKQKIGPITINKTKKETIK